MIQKNKDKFIFLMIFSFKDRRVQPEWIKFLLI